MFARVHELAVTSEQHEQGLELVRDQLLPWTRETSGFCGLISLVDRGQGRSLVITLWADEEALRASAEAAERLGALAAEATGAERRALNDYEVSLFDVPRRVRP